MRAGAAPRRAPFRRASTSRELDRKGAAPCPLGRETPFSGLIWRTSRPAEMPPPAGMLRSVEPLLVRTFILPLARKGLSVLALSIAGVRWLLRPRLRARSPRKRSGRLRAWRGISSRPISPARPATRRRRRSSSAKPFRKIRATRNFSSAVSWRSSANGSMNEAYRAAERLASPRSVEQSGAVRPGRARSEGAPLRRRSRQDHRRQAQSPDGSHRDAPDRLVLCRLEGPQARACDGRPAEERARLQPVSANITPR